MGRRLSAAWLAGPYLLWSLAFTLIPLVLIFYFGFTDPDGHFTWSNLTAIGDPDNLKALALALLLAAIATILCLVIAYPIAMIIAGLRAGSSALIAMLFILPMWMNFLLRTIAWQNLLENNGVINTVLKFLHLPAIAIINTPGAIILGMVYNFLPFMILPIYTVLTKIDREVVMAARDLGAGPWQTFARITLPLSKPGIISGITMVFVPALTTFVITDLLGGGKIQLIGNTIEQEFIQGSSWHVGSGLSIVLMIFVIASMALIAKYDPQSTGAVIGGQR
ncbi:MAG: ABC transporter permease [Lachnospiraceae bacterium]|nr:ABC transporter permease [Lachnospiraceae bacterium]